MRKNKAAVSLKTVNLKTVLRFTAALFFLLKLFSSHIYCILKLQCLSLCRKSYLPLWKYARIAFMKDKIAHLGADIKRRKTLVYTVI